MTSLKTSIKTITYLSDIGCLEIQGASLFGLRPSLGYVYSKGKDLYARDGHKGVDADRVNYIEVGTWYYFNKNMNVYTAYKFNLLDKDDAAITDAATDDQFAVGIVYQF